MCVQNFLFALMEDEAKFVSGQGAEEKLCTKEGESNRVLENPVLRNEESIICSLRHTSPES